MDATTTTTTTTQKLRITALSDNCRRFCVVFMCVKVAVAFGRDSGAKVGYDAIMISGAIGSGGSRVNWYCRVDEGSIFEIEVDAEFYRKNKNRITKWEIDEINDFTITKNRSNELIKMENNIE
jgi:hypothetical protein